jgi:hypothetical protein
MRICDGCSAESFNIFSTSLDFLLKICKNILWRGKERLYWRFLVSLCFHLHLDKYWGGIPRSATKYGVRNHAGKSGGNDKKIPILK